VIRKRWTLLCLALALLVIVVPWVMFATQPRATMYQLTRSLGLWQDDIAVNIWFISAFLVFIAALLQFPFKEEEAWTCECGYDLSFLAPESENCPECGKSLQLEWTATHGQYSRKTIWRIRLTSLLFFIMSAFICLGLIAKWMIEIAGA